MLRKLLIVVFSLAAAGFFFRFVESGHQWWLHRHGFAHLDKTMMLWSALYVAIFAGLALAVAQFTSPNDGGRAEERKN